MTTPSRASGVEPREALRVLASLVNRDIEAQFEEVFGKPLDNVMLNLDRVSGVEPRTIEDIVDAMTDALESENLYHGRHGTTPAGRATAMSLLSCLRNHKGLELAALRQDTPEELDVERLTAAIHKTECGFGSHLGVEDLDEDDPNPCGFRATIIAREFAALPSTTEDPK